MVHAGEHLHLLADARIVIGIAIVGVEVGISQRLGFDQHVPIARVLLAQRSQRLSWIDLAGACRQDVQHFIGAKAIGRPA